MFYILDVLTEKPCSKPLERNAAFHNKIEPREVSDVNINQAPRL